MKKEITEQTEFKGFRANGFLMLFINLLIAAAFVFCIVETILSALNNIPYIPFLICAFILLFFNIVVPIGFCQIEPNEARVMVFFGKYKGTFYKTGFFWFNPFLKKKKVSLRARNLDGAPIKVNDKIGNPVMVGLVLVWKLKDTYKAMFEIDSQTMAGNLLRVQNAEALADDKNLRIPVSFTASLMQALENFVKIQSDAALRQVAAKYNYDNNEGDASEITLRSGGDEINVILEQKLSERLAMAGIEVVEARINYLAYAPEIAAVMLRRQQAAAVIAAREKIVEGAVSMVKLAIDKLEKEDVVKLDVERKASMVSNLMVVLCSEDSTKPVVNTGTLYN